MSNQQFDVGAHIASRLSENQLRFFNLLHRYPQIEVYWDHSTATCQTERLKQAMGSLSHGEAVMARFFAGVWFGSNELGFDLIDAVGLLEEKERSLVASWFAEPFWP
jgi:hypothetical protein